MQLTPGTVLIVRTAAAACNGRGSLDNGAHRCCLQLCTLRHCERDIWGCSHMYSMSTPDAAQQQRRRTLYYSIYESDL